MRAVGQSRGRACHLWLALPLSASACPCDFIPALPLTGWVAPPLWGLRFLICNMEADTRETSEVPSCPGSQCFHISWSQEFVFLYVGGQAASTLHSQSASLWRDKVQLRGPCVCLVVKAKCRRLGVFKNLEPLGFGVKY